MTPPPLPPLTGWETFYVIVGSSAAALTGLMFVVIALGAETRSIASEAGLRAFATPTIVHFGAVVLLAAFLTTPGHTIASLRICLLLCAVAGLVYAVFVFKNARKQTHYAPVLSDWIWHVCLPAVAYAGLLAAALRIGRAPGTALYIVGASALLLLFVGIHNSWDSAVWMTAKRQELRDAEKE